MGHGLGIIDTARLQPLVHLLERGKVKPGREEALADRADLVLHLTLFPARARRAGHRLDQVMGAHLRKTQVEAVLRS